MVSEMDAAALYFAAVVLVCTSLLSNKKRSSASVRLEALLQELGASESEWLYKAEGGANVAYTYAGGCRALRGHLLRLRKVQPDRKLLENVGELLPHDPMTYAQCVMRPRIGEEYVVPGVEVRMQSEILASFNCRLHAEPKRSHTRRYDTIDVDAGKAVLMVDHTFLVEPWAQMRRRQAAPTRTTDICVEIKPKSGVCQVGPQAKSTVCRFCMHQVQKCRKAGAGCEMSMYCPMALYSEDPSIVKQALYGLLQTPQNNFRLFVNGLHVDGPATGCGSACCSPWVCNALAAVSGLVVGSTSGPRPCSAQLLVDTLTQVLMADGILQKLRSVQADTPLVEEIWRDYQTLCGLRIPSHSDEGMLLTQALQDEFKAHAGRVESYLASAPSELRTKFEKFFISTTAKDCSLMVTLQMQTPGAAEILAPSAVIPSDVSHTTELETGHVGDEHLRRNRGMLHMEREGLDVHYSIAIVDLDPKPFSRIPHYAALERELQDLYARHGADVMKTAGKTCFASALVDS
jgi:inositol-pentakisphosphate 2-kinase